MRIALNGALGGGRASAWRPLLSPPCPTPLLIVHEQRRTFTAGLKVLKHQDTNTHGHNEVSKSEARSATPQKSIKRKPGRSQTTTSLRRVAVEAQRSRSFIKGTGKRRFVDPDADTKDVTASCSAEQYDIPLVKRLLEHEGLEIDPLRTGLYPQVIHVRISNENTGIPTADNEELNSEKLSGVGDIFIFPSGSVVSWNVPERLQKDLVHRVLVPAAENLHLSSSELEDLEYLEDATKSTSTIIGDTIILGIKPSSTDDADATENKEAAFRASASEVDTILAKIAFSSGLARSTKLAVLENQLSSYFESTKSIPTILSRGSTLRFTRSFILRKTGELLSIRAQLNLYSELTDELPDLFWDSPSSLGLSDYYDEVGRALDIAVRIRVLNEKMDYASEIASVLRERLSEKHSTGLEWLIIFLISVEVGFELRRIWRENEEAQDPNSNVALMNKWLLAQMKEQDAA